MQKEPFVLKVRFRGRFTSYSPAVNEGFLDSTTLHAALVSAAALAGIKLEDWQQELVVGSLLPLIECGGREVALLPPLRIPGSARVRYFWTPRAAEEALRAIKEAPKVIIMSVPRRGPCGHGPEIALKAGERVLQLSVAQNQEVVYHPDEAECIREFRPPRVSRHYRLAIDRVTQATVPVMHRVVEAPMTPYWAAGYTSDCSAVESAAAVIRKLGIGALRSAGYGALEQVDVLCGKKAEERVRGILQGLKLVEAGGGEGVLLGLFKPRKGGDLEAYGEEWEYGSHRGYGGLLQPFRRPLVRALSPGSIALRAPHPEGEVYSVPGVNYYYSFHTITAGVK